MNTTRAIKEAARKYAESLFDKENTNETAYKNAVEFAIRDFEAGANWIAEHPRATFEMVESTARSYAKQFAEPGETEDIENSFIEGASWYQEEISKRWTSIPVDEDGNYAYQIEIKQTWYEKTIDFLFRRTFIGWGIIGMIVIFLFLYIIL